MSARPNRGEREAIWASERGTARVDIAGFRVVDLVAFEVGVPGQVIVSASRRGIVDWARLACVYLLHRRTNAALYQVSRLLGRTQQSLIALLARAEALHADDGEFQRAVRICTASLEAG